MAILINKKTRVICQGITGRQATLHCRGMLDSGTCLVGGVVPGKGGESHLDLPVYDAVSDAVQATEATVSVIFVPADAAADAILEAAETTIELIICITRGVPVQDMLMIKAALKQHSTQLIGPNSPGVISPGECQVGVMQGDIHQRGSIGIVSRSGTLLYEAAYQTTRAGLGQSTCIGIGSEPVLGMNIVDCLAQFEQDRQTKGIILVGEVAGSGELQAAEYIKKHVRKPVVAYIAGTTSPQDNPSHYFGAPIGKSKKAAQQKILALESAGAYIVRSPAELGTRMLEYFKG